MENSAYASLLVSVPVLTFLRGQCGDVSTRRGVEYGRA